MLKIWEKKIPRKDKKICSTNYVCALHFKAEDIMTYFEIEMPGRIVQKTVKRQYPILRKTAIPTIFPNLPKYLSSTKQKRPNPKPRSNIPCKIKKIEPYNNYTLNENIINDEFKLTEEINELIDSMVDQTMVHFSSAEISFNDNYATCPQDTFTVEHLHTIANKIKLPGSMWGIHQIPGKCTVFTHLNENLENDKTVHFSTSCFSDVKLVKKSVYFPIVKSFLELQNLLNNIHNLVVCIGTTDGKWSAECLGNLPVNRTNNNVKRCSKCNQQRRKLQKIKQYNTELRKKLLAKKIKSRSSQNKRLRKKVVSLQQKMNILQNKYSCIKKSKLDSYISELPNKQKQLVKACFDAAKCKLSNGRRYTTSWAYECLLMHIKSPKLYRKMRKDNIMPLPSYATLLRYIKRLRPAYGFSQETFQILGMKSKNMRIAERHGCLMLDEMKLSETLNFQRSDLKIKGFVDLGDFTPENDRNKIGDHALVLLFQPFCGKWFQTVGAFLGSGAVSGKLLEKIITEAVILLENQNIHVDVITNDGATWNRSMWKLFGISEKSSSCTHPVNPERKVWFVSDFSHLIKNLKSRIINSKTLQVPEGVVDLFHWKAVVKADSKLQIKVFSKLTQDHIQPRHFQTMNVRMAFQFFSGSVAAAMEYYKDSIPDLAKCEATISFIKQINKVIDAMNSQLPKNALRPDPEQDANPQQKLTTSTALGLKVTIRTTLELMQYLSEEVGYHYLMTRRINQDSLEHFFGSTRDACGSGTHPDSLMFIQVYRLLSTYSLVRPPRGSNVSGETILEAIISMEDIKGDEKNERRREIEEKIDTILENTDIEFSSDMTHDHDYTVLPIDPNALTVLAGYVARKMRKTKPAKDCDICFMALCSSENDNFEDLEKLLKIKSYGYLLVPSKELYEIIYQLEDAICKKLTTEHLHNDLLFSIMNHLVTESSIIPFGCEEHAIEMTRCIIMFYLQCRMHFVCNEANSVREKDKKHNNLSKQSKLC
ncbi:hypothetical protein ACI65C_005239 [Semiaphis heraclei]